MNNNIISKVDKPKNKDAIKVFNFKKVYKKNQGILNPISFSVSQGSIHGLIGVNGSGKTTTIKAIVGAIKEYAGSIFVNGQNIAQKSFKEQIGYIPEVSQFPKNMSVKKYLIYLAYISGFSFSKAKKLSKKMLIEFNILDLARKKPNKLSSGQKRKITLIQALMNKPKILILDEPAANLDPIAREEFFNFLLKAKAQGTTILITSHVLAELENIIDEVTIINDGAIIYSGNSNFLTKEKTLSKAFIDRLHFSHTGVYRV